MMYILTQEELDDLKNKKADQRIAEETVLQDLCTRVANSEILTEGWMKGETWGCILSTDNEWYCDDCPVQGQCPYPYKAWSK